MLAAPRARLALTVLLAGCAAEDYTRLYATAPHAPSFSDEDVQSLSVLGPRRIDRGVNFSVYSEHATRVELLLFDDAEAALPAQQFALEPFGDVWSVYVEGVGLGQHYGYIAFGPNWTYDAAWYPGAIDGFLADVDADGNRFNPNKLLFDPYSRLLHRDHDWTRGSVASGPDRVEPTYGAAAKSVVVESAYRWSEHEDTWRTMRRDAQAPGHRWTDLVIYEVHLKGFTQSEASGVAHPGTFRGFGEKAAYLQDLGITAVELLPVFEKPVDGGYWGYQTLNFFAPEISYAGDQEHAGPLDEFKWMVDELHQHGIEVLLDVVYNHTGEGGLWREKIEQDDVAFDVLLENFDPKEIAGLYSYRGLDNQAYYALSEDGQTYWNNTGVGNETRANHVPMRRLILDSLRYWAQEMHVDGFRFDLAPVLGEVDRDYNTWDDPANTVLQEIIDDPVLREHNTRIIAEPWSLQHFRLGAFPAASDAPGVAWFDWNANFRDVWRTLVNNDVRRSGGVVPVQLNSAEGPIDVGGALTGSYALFDGNGRRPYHSVNFVTVHDGFPLYDLFSFDQKLNGCGLLNPTCCNDRFSAFCDRDSGENNNRSRNWGVPCAYAGADEELCNADPFCGWSDGSCQPDALPAGFEGEAFKRQQMRNMFAAMLVAHGTPMLYGGDEWMRTQYGNNNAYSTGADNAWNWFDWGVWTPSAERRRMHDFVRSLIALRQARLERFAPSSYTGAAPFTWRNAAGAVMSDTDWTGRALCMHYSGEPELLVLFNMAAVHVDFTLPPGTWGRLVDTQLAFDITAYFASGERDPGRSYNVDLAGTTLAEGTYGAPARTVIILEEREE